MKAVGKVSVGRLHDRTGEDHRAAEQAGLRQVHTELARKQRLKHAKGRGVDIDSEMTGGVQQQRIHAGAGIRASRMLLDSDGGRRSNAGLR